jgi:hypothetical protein
MDLASSLLPHQTKGNEMTHADFAEQVNVGKSYTFTSEQLRQLVSNVTYEENQRIVKIICDLVQSGKSANLYDVLDKI